MVKGKAVPTKGDDVPETPVVLIKDKAVPPAPISEPKAAPAGTTTFNPAQDAGGMTVKVNMRAIDFAIIQKLIDLGKMKDPSAIVAVGFITELNKTYKDATGEDAKLTVFEIEKLYTRFKENSESQARQAKIMDTSMPQGPRVHGGG